MAGNENRLDPNRLDPQWAWAPFEPDARRPWTRQLAAHLYRRAGFGATAAELDEALQRTPAEAVDQLLDAVEPAAYRDQAEDLRAAALAGGDVQRGAAAWLHRMLTSPSQTREKMTLFWHGHFATGAEKVEDLQLMDQQNQLLRAEALGDFRRLAHEISRDPAMLIYLDSVTNRKSHPNENYARELMELFCLGEGSYTEQDVLELARRFTGWEVKRKRFRFNKYQHDTGEKQILGRRGPFTGEQAVDIVLEQPACERFLTRKLVRFFVLDEPACDDRLLAPLAATFRAADLQVLPLLRQMLKSNLFYSEYALGRKVRSPIELAVGLLRSTEASTNVVWLAQQLRTLGHALYYPPNVKGWDGGRTWINTSTLLGRANMVRGMLSAEQTRFAGRDLAALLKSHGAGSADAAAQWLSQLLLAVPLPESSLRQLATLAAGGTDAELKSMLHALAASPEYQLA